MGGLQLVQIIIINSIIITASWNNFLQNPCFLMISNEISPDFDQNYFKLIYAEKKSLRKACLTFSSNVECVNCIVVLIVLDCWCGKIL